MTSETSAAAGASISSETSGAGEASITGFASAFGCSTTAGTGISAGTADPLLNFFIRASTATCWNKN